MTEETLKVQCCIAGCGPAGMMLGLLLARSGIDVVVGAIEQIRARGLEAFRTNITTIASFVGDRVTELRDWDDVSVLSVRVDRLRRWYRPGLLCIGDAAHAMSPVGGVGINLAIQDAVAAVKVISWKDITYV